MLSDQLMQLVELQADRLEKRWEYIIHQHPATPSYHHLNDKALAGRIKDVYSHLRKYLDDPEDSGQLSQFFMEVGARRREQNIPLHEIVYTIILARRNIWEFIMEEGPCTSTLQWHQVNECWDRLLKFFDNNIYYVVVGYEEGTQKRRREKDKVSSLIHSFSMGVFPEVEKRA